MISARATAPCRTCGTFPIDTLKIDRVFVRDIASKSAGNAPLVDAIIAMAKSLGLATVAEGVETEAQWQYLRIAHADQVQGYLFCRPLADRGSGTLARRLAAFASAGREAPAEA